MEHVNLDLKFQNHEQEVAKQWLVNLLKGEDIGVVFGLYMIKYTTSAKIVWVCKEHKEGLKKWQHGIVAYSLKISPPLKWHIT